MSKNQGPDYMHDFEPYWSGKLSLVDKSLFPIFAQSFLPSTKTTTTTAII